MPPFLRFLRANLNIQVYLAVGASYDALVDLFESDSNETTRQFRKCSIDSIDRTFSDFPRHLYRLPCSLGYLIGELLSTLAIVTKKTNQGQPSKSFGHFVDVVIV